MKVDVPRTLKALGIKFEELGDEIWACCPYPDHNEDTPSWSIKSDANHAKYGSHHCFGCGRGGGPVDLVMESVGLSGYGAARDWILKRKLTLDGVAPLSIEVRLRRAGVRKELDAPKHVIESYSRWTTNAKRYAAKRGLTAEQIERWGIGCVALGPLAGRLYFPIRDRNGILLSYTARDYTGEARSRYKEPRGKGEEGAHPSAVFGEEYWPEDTSEAELILCEGALNALACERVGARHVGALYGSDLHRSQLLKLQRFGSIVIASDLDKAGNKMARKLYASFARWRPVRRIAFPGGMDPNDVERKDPNQLKELLWGKRAARVS